MELTKYGKRTIAAIIIAIVLAVFIFFFTYFRVEEVTVTGNSHYTEAEIKEKILRGPMADNTILAPVLYGREELPEFPFITDFTINRINRNTLQIRVEEQKIVGCFFYLDSYIYFDRNAVFVAGSHERDESVPFFEGVEVSKVVMNKELPIKKSGVLNMAITLTTIFQKSEMVPDNIRLNQNSQIELTYGDIVVSLGDAQYLEDKMNRVLAILPLISGKKGILHLENVTNTVKTITFELDEAEFKKQQEESEEAGSEYEDAEYDSVYDTEYDTDYNYDSAYDYNYDSAYDYNYDSTYDYDSGYGESYY